MHLAHREKKKKWEGRKKPDWVKKEGKGLCDAASAPKRGFSMMSGERNKGCNLKRTKNDQRPYGAC